MNEREPAFWRRYLHPLGSIRCIDERGQQVRSDKSGDTGPNFVFRRTLQPVGSGGGQIRSGRKPVAQKAAALRASRAITSRS
jgi:hypothetical protein